jgi:hypothetical protein
MSCSRPNKTCVPWSRAESSTLTRCAEATCSPSKKSSNLPPVNLEGSRDEVSARQQPEAVARFGPATPR